MKQEANVPGNESGRELAGGLGLKTDQSCDMVSVKNPLGETLMPGINWLLIKALSSMGITSKL